ncbi:MAG: GNAT family N-acetyltransferase [Eubacteriales bacterium]
MIITNGKLNDKEDVRKLWDECFDEDSTEWRDWYFENVYKESNVIGGKENGELAAMVHMNPYDIFMRGSRTSAVAMAGVATKQKYRKQGFADKLIKYSLKKAYEMGYDFSFLYPFNYEFYEKYGYLLSYNKYSYYYKYFNDTKTKEMIKTKQFSEEMFSKIYSRFAAEKNGFVIRDAVYYKKHLKELLCDRNELLCFYIGSKAGYLSLNIDENKAEELVYEGDIAEAIKSAAAYYERDLTFENLFDSDNIVNTKEKHCMARIISVESIFRKMKLKDCDIKIEINDDIIDENNGVWHIISRNEKTEVQKVQDMYDYKIDISLLAPIITGFKLENEKVSEIQNALFSTVQPYIYEVC